MVAIAVPVNTVFGVFTAMALVRWRWRGKSVVNALIDLPFAVSPGIIGLALILVYGRLGWFGGGVGGPRHPGVFSIPGGGVGGGFCSPPLLLWGGVAAVGGGG